MQTNSGRVIVKVLLLALIFAAWAFISVGCASQATSPDEQWNKTFEGAFAPKELDDSSSELLLVGQDFTVQLSKENVAKGDSFTINGFDFWPNDSLNLLIIGPKGYGSTLIDGNGNGIYNTIVTVDAEGNFSKEIHVGVGVDTGEYAVVVLTPGRDEYYGTYPGTTVNNFVDDLENAYDLTGKTQAQLIELIKAETVYATGSDDLMWLGFIDVYASGAEWHVYPGQSIQTAINNADVGDTIYVHAGTYVENVNVDKRLILIGIDNPVIDAGALGSAIYLNADGITLQGFTTTNPRPTLGDGGIMVNSDNNTLKNNSAFYNNFCVGLNYSNNNTIIGNDASNSDAWGIVLSYSHNNLIVYNRVNNNFFPAINMFYSNNNTIKGNAIANTNFQGIYLFDSSNNTITENDLSENLYGIYLSDFSVNNKICFNNFRDNTLGQAADEPGANSWDNGYPAGGNYWSDYTGVDEFSGVNQDEPGSDGIGDTPYDIPPAGAEDRYPLMRHWGVNHPPDLSNGSVTPLEGNTSTIFTYTVIYTDADNDSPTEKFVIIDGNWYTMSTTDTTYTDGSVFSYSTTHSNGTHNFYFVFNDSVDSVRDPISGVYQGPNVLYLGVHNLNTGKSYFTIQAAINDSYTLSGHTITVDSGTHTENVMVNKPLTIKSSSGNPEDTIIYAADPKENVFWITASNVNLSGFCVKGATGEGESGIRVDFAYYCNITNNIILNNYRGVEITSSANNNTVDGNRVCNNTVDGIFLGMMSHNNTIEYNIISNNSACGIELHASSNNTITKNNISKSGQGISICRLLFFPSNNNRITYNTISSNDCGIHFYNSSSNSIYLNNFINNTDNVLNYGFPTNIWNSTEKIEYIYNTTTYKNYLGNYWDDYEEKYPDAEEIDETGIGDTPYSIDSDQDYYPLLMPCENYVEAPANQPPVASFSYLPVNPRINEIVTFNASASYDSDGTIISYNWSFGNGNLTNTTDSTTTQSYASVGNYTVNLTVTDDEGATNTTSRTLQVSLKPPIATFSCSPPNPAVNETVTFNASGSYDPNGVITSYEFEFGDGTNATGEVVIHSYSLVGTYTVNLTLTDDEGAKNRTSKIIKVFSDVSYFDTEPGTYPSISGTHNGTIKMTHTVNVSTIFLYPCAGTGGHIEYARIWNASWDGSEARWNGYVDDWQNLSFDTNFTLVAGERYNYTIRTGSYPQIHHQPELLTAKGWITCTEFTDANGKRYCTWIPAIRLE